MLVKIILVITEREDSDTFPEVQHGISCMFNLKAAPVGRVPSQSGYLVKMVLHILTLTYHKQSPLVNLILYFPRKFDIHIMTSFLERN